MSRYAEKTGVSSDRSRAEIEKTLRRYGAERFVYGWGPGEAQIGFHIGGRAIRFRLPMPDAGADEFVRTPTRRTPRTPEAQAAAYEQAVRQRWRALSLVIKAKLEAVEAGITSIEDEFLAHIALPSGATVGEWVGPQLAEVYGRGHMPALLPGGAA